jgi:HEPN domain-containing protein
VNRADFQDLARLRIAEAECLYKNGFFDGAFYLAGYAVEAGLKACIAKNINQYDFPPKNTQRDCYTHDLELLLKSAGLAKLMGDDRKANGTLNDHWNTVTVWKEDCRYESRGSRSQMAVAEFLEAITATPDGVLRWIEKRW